LTDASLECLVAGQRAAEALSLELVVALPGLQPGPLLERFSAYRVDRLVAVEHELLQDYNPDAYVEALAGLVQQLEAAWVFFPNSYLVRDFAPRVAARFERSLISDCVDLRSEGGQPVMVRQLFQGKLLADVQAVGEGPHFVSFQPAAFSTDQLAAATEAAAVETLPVSLELTPRVKLQAPVQEGESDVDLSQADVIVSVGRGIGEEGNIEAARRLAEAVGGELGASRPVCDEGWLSIDHQIGSSGQTVAPRLYIALGISGASQHLMGMKGATTIVAVNKDPKAPIFKVADYGIVGDVMDVIPALVEALGG
jgi:electron transfer flavoprotein alpha subunit